MAKKQLTIEEKLQAALVPVEEQPYKVPENWCWVKLGTVITASKEKQDAFDSETKYVGLEHIEKDTGNISFALADEVKSTKSVFKCGDILYGKLRPYLNKHGIVDFNGVCSTDILVFNAIKGDNRLYDFYFSLPHFIEYAVSNSKGINLPRVSEKVILEIPFPMPPQGEQSRIVARIESLFAKLDEAKEKIQEVLDGADLRRAAILHQAFTGKLTEKWREENNKSFSDWQTVELKDCFDITGGIQKKPSRKPDRNPIPYITVANVYRDSIDISDIRYFEVFEGELEKYQLMYGDILIVEGNGSGKEIGRCAIWREELPVCIHQNHIIRARKKDESIVPEYVLYYLNSSMGIRIMQERARTTSGLYSLSTGKIKTIIVPKAPVEEQQEIVRLLDNLLSREQSTVTACEEALTTIETLKKSILARAFRGELGTNDPAEPSAQGLLQEILEA